MMEYKFEKIGILPALDSICQEYMKFCKCAKVTPREEIVIYANKVDLERRINQNRSVMKGGGQRGDEISSGESKYK